MYAHACLCALSVMQKLLDIGLITETLISLLLSCSFSASSALRAPFIQLKVTQTRQRQQKISLSLFTGCVSTLLSRRWIDRLCVRWRGYKSQQEVKAVRWYTHVNAQWTFSSKKLFLMWESRKHAGVIHTS